MKWLWGFIISFIFIWGVSAEFMDSIAPYVHDPDLDLFVPAAGTHYYGRKEGWGSTVYGKHGLEAIPDIARTKKPKVIFWGDSYVEAFQVSDKYKMQTRFTDIWNEQAPERPLLGVGIGTGGYAIADYCLLMERYSQIIKPTAFHVIVVGTMLDLLPDHETGIIGDFVSRPEYRFKPAEKHEPMNLGVRNILARLRINFSRLVIEKFLKRDWLGSLRFSPGPVAPTATEPKESDAIRFPHPEGAWNFILDAVHNYADRPVIFVYLPDVCRIENGRVRLDDPQAELARSFAAACRKRGVLFLDMGPRFIAGYLDHRILPRGFPTSTPGKGHLNKYGHNMIAEEIVSAVMRSAVAL